MSARPGADVPYPKATEARKPDTPGRARYKPSNHCAGNVGSLPLNLYARVRFLPPFCTRDRGCSAHPAFPAPSDSCGAKLHANPRANYAARSRGCVWGEAMFEIRTHGTFVRTNTPHHQSSSSGKSAKRVFAQNARATQYSRAASIDPRSRGVLDPRMRGADGRRLERRATALFTLNYPRNQPVTSFVYILPTISPASCGPVLSELRF